MMLPVNESVTGNRQQFPTVFIMKGAGTVGKLHTSRQSVQTCREDTHLKDICSSSKTNMPNHVTAARYENIKQVYE